MMDISISSSNAVVAKTDIGSLPKSTQAEAVFNQGIQQHNLSVVEEGSAQALNQNERSDNVSAEELQGIADQLSSTMEMMKKGLQFRVDDESGTNIVSVMDISSGEVIRQIPSDEALELASKLSDVAAGLLMKTEA